MDPRLYIAAHALQGLLAHQFVGNENNGWSNMDGALAAAVAVRCADALIAELRKTSPAAAASPSATPPAETTASGQEVDVARLERVLLHATSPCGGNGPMEMRGGEPYEPPCVDCAEVTEVRNEVLRRRAIAQQEGR